MGHQEIKVSESPLLLLLLLLLTPLEDGKKMN